MSNNNQRETHVSGINEKLKNIWKQLRILKLEKERIMKELERNTNLVIKYKTEYYNITGRLPVV